MTTSTPVRLALFAAVLAGATVVGAFLGGAIGPIRSVDDVPAVPASHSADDHGGTS